MKVLLVDDEELAIEELKFILGRMAGVSVVGAATSGKRAIELCRKMRPDVVFLDIRLGDMSGMEAARRMMLLEKPPRIVFATAYDEFAVKAFEMEALDYVLKPFTERRLRKTIRRLAGRTAGQERGAESGRFPHRDAVLGDFVTVAPEPGSKLLLIDINDITYVEAQGRRCVVRTSRGVFRCNHSLGEMEKRLLSGPFFRPHRSYLINLKRIKEIVPWFNGTYLVRMDGSGDTEIPVTRGNASEFRRILGF